ncbi:hypothetical protein ACWDDN_46065 [Streptomyces griseoruber]
MSRLTPSPDRKADHERIPLAELVEFARRNSPYYRDLYAEVPTGRTLRLEDLPVITTPGSGRPTPPGTTAS